ncbi:TonB-dependent copper receptor [Pseudothauera nasutitermitis]|uniref:TonB-dependent copper receptor n=1 Tax=Pseudothauera nasutitermitis TaxID=2565930 RepID=A0A4S4B3I0_9RHOO|nr:TonB-dependent copper receptor [Pseudothauera nasutitermitis]THF67115.1 TonB-dependent copper receptor [Pseudothauera nasutitermitis]
MKSLPSPSRLALALCAMQTGMLCSPALSASATENTLGTVVVTAPTSAEALTVVTDPKAPRQPIPAHDGADFLKSIPGFAVIRKGATDGDPVFRGMAGSRLGIFLDGQEIYGGCGGRMDPPTAYVYPESYDRVTVLKGPQTVLYGAGVSAGAVLFERDLRPLKETGWSLNGSLTVGSFGRNDQVIDVKGGTPQFQIRAGATHAHANDYEDGDGTRIHSRYTRWNTQAALAWTPDEHTALELSAARSDGKAAYADRGMDGSRFARDNVALKFEKRELSPLVQKIWAQAYHNYVDHVMDNYSLRDQVNANGFAAMNPDRITVGARAGITLTPGEALSVTLGMDTKRDTHRSRGAMMQASADAAKAAYRSLPYVKDMNFRQFGVFGEAAYTLQDGARMVGGLRVDRHAAKDERACVDAMMCMMSPNPTRGKTDRDTLTSGFLRYEGLLALGNWYAGLGHAERFPDYWERLKRDEDTLTSAFLTIKPEKTTQLDVGLNWQHGAWNGSVSAYYGKVQDYILLKWVAPTRVRNVDATIYGLEADATWRFARSWSTTATLAWAQGANDTDGKALAQQPPLEGRLSLDYDDGTFSYGALLRLVAAQKRVDIGSGNIVSNGQDIGKSSGFGVLSLNAGWRPKKGVLLTAGIDNVFDRAYAEHLSRTGASLPGFVFPANTRINEPGRNAWLKVQIALN